MATKTRGAPHPLGSDANDTAGWLDQLAAWVNDRPGVAALTTTQRNALTGVDRWDGKLVLDTTLDRLFRWDAGTTTWIQIADSSEVAGLLATTGLPAALAVTASRGVGASAARADHVHPAPAWQDYTPTWTNVTVGNGNRLGRYVVLGKTVHFWAYFALGSTSAMGTNPTASLPLTSAAQVRSVVNVFMQDVGANFHLGWGIVGNNASTVTCYGLGGPGGTGGAATISATTPFTWTGPNGDDMYVSGTYEAA